MSGLTRTENLQRLLKRSHKERNQIECGYVVTRAMLELTQAVLECYADDWNSANPTDPTVLIAEIQQALVLGEVAAWGSFTPAHRKALRVYKKGGLLNEN